MAKKYYKVVQKDTLKSCCANSSFPERFRVTYEVGKWIKPIVNGTRLFIFKDLQSAQDFLSNHFNGAMIWSIYECEVKNPRKDRVASLYYIEKYWDLILNSRKKKVKYLDKLTAWFMWNAPANTYSATEVKLIKEIE